MAILKSKQPEELLIDAVIKHFRKKSFFNIYREVAFLSKRIDIVLANRSTNEIYAIETKVHWWNKVIEQAKIDMLGADKVYIALPDKTKHLLYNYRNHLDKYGIGLLVINRSCNKSHVTELIPPSKSFLKGISYSKELRTSLENGFCLSNS